ncbi:cytokine receptor family member b4 [Tachysurus ichikawai]
MHCSRQLRILSVWTFFFFLIHKVHCSLPSPQNVTIASFNLEHKLTWTPGPGTAAFTHFRVQSYNQKRKHWSLLKSCSDLQIGESCDLTESFKATLGLYQARVQAFDQDQESNWTTSKFFTPLLDTTLGPPLVSLTGCGNCLILKLSPPAILDFYQDYTISVSRTRDKAQFVMKASSGETLINYLEPGVEYCITATAVTSFKNLAIPSEPQCAYTSSQPLNTVGIFLSVLCAVFFLVLLLCTCLIYSGKLGNLHTPPQQALMSFLLLLERSKDPRSAIMGSPAWASDVSPMFQQSVNPQWQTSAYCRLPLSSLQGRPQLTIRDFLIAEVPMPQNLRIKSENLGFILEWDPPQTSSGKDFRYTAEYKSWNVFNAVCVNVSSSSCDFTSEVTPYGKYKLRVQTELNGKSSAWMEIDCEPLEIITVISAPDVKLQSRRGKMEVDITEPVLRKSSLKDVYTNIKYQIRYWTEENRKEVKLVDQRRVMLLELLPNTRYCMEVEIIMGYKIKNSLPSNITCEMNTASDEVASWLIAVVLFVSFLVTLISVLLISMTVWFGYRGIQFLHPRAKIPEHFKQYLTERPSSAMLLAMQNSTQPKEPYHEISIITAEEVPPESTQKEHSQPT